MTHIPELDDPVSHLFLSCDLTGSTNFKQQQEQDDESRIGPQWQHVFLDFYRDFPQEVAAVQRNMTTEKLKFDLWKPVGDELIYSCKVTKEDDVYKAVRTWIAAMRSYEVKLADTGMGTKGGAFIATFPGPDSKSSVPRDPDTETSGMDPVARNRAAYEGGKDHSKFLYDYFGPSIDTGFRILKECSSRYFTVSVEVTLAMIGRSKALGKDESDFHVKDFVLLQFEELKGVWQGRPYPIVAIDLDYDDPVHQAHAAIHRRGTRRELLKLCRACYKDEKWPSWLFLPDSTDDHFKTPPVDKLAITTTTPKGLETKANDEPADATDLEAEPPLGEAVHRTGLEVQVLPAATTRDEAMMIFRRVIEENLNDDERIARLDVAPMGKSKGGQRKIMARWIAMKGEPTDSTAPTNIPYKRDLFDTT